MLKSSSTYPQLTISWKTTTKNNETMLPHITLFVILIGHALASDSSNLTQMFDIKDDPKWEGRLSSVNTTSPLTRYFRQNPDADKAISQVFDYIDTVWNVVETRRKNNDSLACNLYKTTVKDWPYRMISRLKIFQIGKVDESCFSQLNLRTAVSSGELPYTIFRNLTKLFSESRRITTEAFQKIRLVPDGNWSSDGKPYNLTYLKLGRSGQTCTVDTIFAHRKNNVWYLRAGVTNAPGYVSNPDFQRQFMQEFFPRNGTRSLQMNLHNIKTGKLERATTVVERWNSNGYAIEQMSFDDLLSPLAEVYQKNQQAIDLASDAITVSNAAILALPLAMNLIPAAFITDLRALGMFTYIVVTDVFSGIPIFIKGVELIRSSNPTQEEAFAYFSGDQKLGCMQSWVVQCKGQGKFQHVGIVFVVVSLVATIVGVALELWAKKYMRWKRALAKDAKAVDGPFGKVALRYEIGEHMQEDEYKSSYSQYKRSETYRPTRGHAV